MNRPMPPLRNASGRLYDAARLCDTLSLLSERNLGEPTPEQIEYVALLIGEALEAVHAATAARLP